MASRSPPHPQGRFSDLPLAIKSIAGFWLFYFLTVVARSALVGGDVSQVIGPRMFGVLVGVLLTALIYLVIRIFASRSSLRRMAVIAALACLPAALIFSLFNLSMFFLQAPLAMETRTEKARDGTVLMRFPDGKLTVHRPDGTEEILIHARPRRELVLREAPRFLADSTVIWYFFFAAWAAFYVAMSSASQLRLAERRASEFESAAQAAQLRALRYQVNPHFLFNTLNSLSSLIMARRDEEAERMIMNLSNFFRATLATDPAADVSLAEEIALQRLYLDIEKARFPKRLRVEVDIPDRLLTARLPALLLQPIVENAIKYGVARTRDTITLIIRATEKEGKLSLIIENDGAEVDPEQPNGDDASTGVGLTNVCQRLTARFGSNASCNFGPRNGGGYRVSLIMPLVIQ